MPNSGNRRGGFQSDDVDRSRAISNKDYYPTVDEMIHSEDETLTKLFASMKKENVVCLLRETVSVARCCEAKRKRWVFYFANWFGGQGDSKKNGDFYGEDRQS